MEPSCVCVSAGARGVSVPHHFHGGGVPEGNSLWPALPPQRLPEERLESARLHHRSRGVGERSETHRGEMKAGMWTLMIQCYCQRIFLV